MGTLRSPFFNVKNSEFYMASRKIFFTAFLILFLSINEYAQLSSSIATEYEYNDNPFRTKYALKTSIYSLNYELGYNFDLVAVNYSGSFISFSSDAARNFYVHQFSAVKSFDNSFLGAYVEQRFGKEIYNYFDYTNALMFYNFNTNFKNLFIRLSSNLSITNYPNITILNNLKYSASIFLNHGFESGTTLIYGSSFNYKKYLSPSQSGTYSYFNENNQLVTESYLDKNISYVVQSLNYVRVAQSITPTTGIAFQFTNRSILNSGFNSYVKDVSMIYGDESEIFDDPVNYEGNSILAELTKIILNDFTIKLGFYFNKKFYPSQGIYDENLNYINDYMRNDKQKIFNVMLKKDFVFGKEEEMNLYLLINYQYIKNQSNSDLFNYNNNSLNIGIGLSF